MTIFTYVDDVTLSDLLWPSTKESINVYGGGAEKNIENTLLVLEVTDPCGDDD